MSTCTEEAPAVTRRVEYTAPRVNLHQDGDGYSLEVEIPGVGKDGVEITAADGKLTIVGHRPEATVPGRPVYRERSEAAYRRVFDLDPSIDPETIEARVDQGLLTVRLHKSESAKPRKIVVA